MKHNALFAALFALAASSAHSVEILDLGISHNAAKRLGNHSLATVTGLTPQELVARSGHVGQTNVTRYVQYYQGIPVLGRPIIAEAAGDTMQDTLELISGTVLRNIGADLPMMVPAQSADAAIAIASTAVRNAKVMDGSTHLYIDVGPNHRARLVYLVDLQTDIGGSARLSFLVDANDGTILDRWNSSEHHLKSVLAPVVDSLKSMGWTQEHVDTLLHHAQSVYWTDGALFADAACGSTAAAKALGFDAAQVQAAFQRSGTCRSTYRDALIELQSNPMVSESSESESAVVPQKVALTSKYSAWRKLKREDAQSIAAFDTGIDWWNRLESLKGTGDHTSGRIYVNDFGADAPASGGDLAASSINWCSRENRCVDLRQKLNGTRTFSGEVDRRDTRFSGLVFENTRTSNTGANRVVEENPQAWYIERATSSSYTVSLASTLSAGASFQFTNFFGASVSVSLERTTSTAQTQTTNIGTQIGHRRLVIRPGCKVTAFVNEVFVPVNDGWVGYPNFQGSMFARGYLPGNGEREYTLDAPQFFSPATSTVSSRANVTMKQNLAYKASYVWAKLRTSAVNCNLY